MFNLSMDNFKEFTFEVPHHLPNMPPEHKCYQIYGHLFCVALHIVGLVDAQSGWIMDFGEAKQAFQPFYDLLDCCYLVGVAGPENSTSENLARWIGRHVRSVLPGLNAVIVVKPAPLAASIAVRTCRLSVGRKN